jgi:C-terminal processing protease CtpA/Prc
MKTLFPIFVLAAVLTGCVVMRPAPKRYADYSSRSGFVAPASDSADVDNLVVLGKVWGFVKYHHPVFADSIYNIDYELFELLPRVAYVGKEERNAILVQWIRGLGEFKTDRERFLREIDRDDHILAADPDWLGDGEQLGAELSGLLQELRYAKRPKPSRYARIVRGGYINFDAESTKAPASSDAGYDLLTLFRLWNMAEYYFPSVNITDKKWSEVLEEYTPKFLSKGDVPEFLKTDSRWTTAELIAELRDTHSGMSSNPVYSASGRRLPVELKFVENRLIVADNRRFLAAGEAPLFEPGDEIISIGGRSPEWFVERTRQHIAASNENGLLRHAARLAGYASGETVRVVVERGGERMEFNVATLNPQDYYTRNSTWRLNHAYYERLNDSTGYLYPARYRREDRAAIMAAFKDTKAIVVDFRCYPSGNLPFEFVGRYFVPRTIQHVIFTLPVRELPGYYKEYPVSLGSKNNDYYKGMVVVLVNEETLSSAEYQTMAFQAAPRTIVVGSQTAGADGNVVRLPLPRGVSTMFSGLGVYYPDGTNTQRTGIRIDHYVEPTIEGIEQGRDELLEKALEIIDSL